MSFFTTGGTVQAGEGLYISRPADEQLLKLCRAGAFVYVLTARQMGKSSLMEATAARLVEEGVVCVFLDLQAIGAKVVSPEQWYLGMLQAIADQLYLEVEVYNWWKKYHHLGVVDRLTRFFAEVLVQEVREQVVVFVDEIDTTLSLDFTDDFFIAIRYFYGARAQKAALKRLSFVLLGAAMPGDLIRDGNRTPFNIGERVDLSDFTLDEALPLAEGLKLPEAQARQVLGWVLDWTGGHPYLTQRLCEEVQRAIAAKASGEAESCVVDEAFVQQLVEKLFLKGGDRSDRNLQFVGQMLTEKAPDLEGVLRTYGEVWRGRRVVDEELSLVKSHLKLAGVVRQGDERCLEVRNEIYRRVFDGGWIKKNSPEGLWERIKQAWPLIAPFAAAAIVAVPYGIYAESQRRSTLKQTVIAQTNESKSLLSNQPLGAIAAAVNAWETSKDNRIRDSQVASHINSALLNAVYHEQEFNSRNPFRREYYIFHGFREKNYMSSHNGWVLGVDISPDGKMIASASGDGTIKLWTSSGKLLKTLSGNGSRFLDVSFGNDGKTIISTSDVAVKIWDLQGNLLRILDSNTDPTSIRTVADGRFSVSTHIHSFDFDKADQEIVTLFNRGAILDKEAFVKFWDQKGDLVKTLKIPKDNPNLIDLNSIKMSPDGEMLAVFSQRELQLWGQNGDFIKTLEIGDDETISSVVFSPDSKIIASTSNQAVKVWSREGKLLKNLIGHASKVSSLDFSPDGQNIVSASRDGTIKIWKWNSEYVLQTIEAHKSNIRSVTFGPTGNMIVSSGDDQTIKIWQRQENLSFLIEGHQDYERKTSLNSGGDLIASASKEKIEFLNWQGVVESSIFLDYKADEINLVRTDRYGNFVVSELIFECFDRPVLGCDSLVEIWNQDGRLVKDFTGFGHGYHAVDFSPDGKVFVSAIDHSVQLWSSNGLLLHDFGEHEYVSQARISPDKKKVISVGNEVMKVWEKRGKLLDQFNYTGTVTDIKISHDDQFIALEFASKDKIFFWDTGKVSPRIIENVSSLEFSPDSQSYIFVMTDGTVKLYSRKSRISHIFENQGNAVKHAAFSPNGEKIAYSTDDGVINIWSKHGILIQSFDSFNSFGYTEVAFSADSQRLIFVNYDGLLNTNVTASGGAGIAMVWEMNTPKLVSWSCKWIEDYLLNNPDGQKAAQEGVCKDNLPSNPLLKLSAD